MLRFLLLIALLSLIRADLINVVTNSPHKWSVAPYPDMSITLGESIIFYYPSVHTVGLASNLSNYESCTNATQIASSTQGVNGFVYLPTEVGTYYIFCKSYNHCSLGQKFILTVDASTGSSANYTVTVDTTKPFWGSSLTYPDLNLNVGDQLLFTFTTGSDVVTLENSTDYENCLLTLKTTLANSTVGSYTWTATAPGQYYFTSSKTNACANHQKFTVTVAGVPEAPVAPGAPVETPVAPVAPAAPGAPVETPVAPGAPVETPVAPGAPVAPVAPVAPSAPSVPSVPPTKPTAPPTKTPTAAPSSAARLILGSHLLVFFVYLLF